jgi:hypothetical protein
VANADIIIADEKLLPQAVDLYNQIFRPRREVDFFKRRFMGRYNTLTLIARMGDKPVGFWIGFELKPGCFTTGWARFCRTCVVMVSAGNCRKRSRPGRKTTGMSTFAVNA